VVGRPFVVLGQALGILSGAALTLLWLYVIWFPAEDGLSITGVSILVAALMGILALVGGIASFKGHTTVVFVVFVASFLPIGAYLLGVAHWLRFVGIFDCGLALAGGLPAMGHRLERGRI